MVLFATCVSFSQCVFEFFLATKASVSADEIFADKIFDKHFANFARN